MRAWLAGVIVVLSAGCALAAGLPDGLSVSEQVQSARAIDGDTLALADGRELRLSGIISVKAISGDAATLGDAARALLEKSGGTGRLDLAFDARRGDRYGRVVAHAINAQGEWLQAELLRAGLARVATSADARRGAAAMLIVENEARQARRGAWALPAWRVRDAAQVAPRDIDSFQIVQGTVHEAASVKGRIYLNFGTDWRQDFTVAVSPAAARLCRAAGLDPAALAGKSLRVRGWIRFQNGPLIDLTHPEQIEVLP